MSQSYKPKPQTPNITNLQTQTSQISKPKPHKPSSLTNLPTQISQSLQQPSDAPILTSNMIRHPPGKDGLGMSSCCRCYRCCCCCCCCCCYCPSSPGGDSCVRSARYIGGKTLLPKSKHRLPHRIAVFRDAAHSTTKYCSSAAGGG